MAGEETAQRMIENDTEGRDDMMDSTASDVAGTSLAQVDVNDLVADLVGWRETLADMLEQLPREAFERLFLRLLGEDGMGEIELTGAKDVIEGMGTIGGGGRVSSGAIDDFRREVTVGRADRGLLITTGKFTQEAELKAGSDRSPEIRLIDGDEFIDKLKELNLGLRTEQVVVERVVIDEAWFGSV